MNVNITNVPFNFRIGLCLPVQCSQDMMDEVAYRINMALIDMFNFLGGFDELYFIKDYNIGLGYNFIEPRNALNDIREGKRTPAIIIACVFFLALLLCLIATFINTYPRIWRKISNLNTKDPYHKMRNQFLKKLRTLIMICMKELRKIEACNVLTTQTNVVCELLISLIQTRLKRGAI